MSDDTLDSERPRPLSQPKSDVSANSAEKPSRKPLFGSLNKDLKNALDTWDTLTEEMSHKMSPEEEQLREVKKLLGELKSKLSAFED